MIKIIDYIFIKGIIIKNKVIVKLLAPNYTGADGFKYI